MNEVKHHTQTHHLFEYNQWDTNWGFKCGILLRVGKITLLCSELLGKGQSFGIKTIKEVSGQKILLTPSLSSLKCLNTTAIRKTCKKTNYLSQQITSQLALFPTRKKENPFNCTIHEENINSYFTLPYWTLVKKLLFSTDFQAQAVESRQYKGWGSSALRSSNRDDITVVLVAREFARV